MSQSDDLETPGGQGQGMQPTNLLRTMVSRGRTFSGHERNCAFLNLGGAAGSPPTFADISVGSGLDFPDDGRAVALGDWDHDGDIDVWFTNRNAPRLRLMRNDSPPGNRSIGLRLRGDGTSTNRDAIGARVEVVAAGARSIQTLRAGEGFISQSSQCLHFGLGEAGKIDSVRVHWPDRDATTEEFGGLDAAGGGRFLLVQGHGKAIPEQPRTAVALEPSTQVPSPSSRSARVPLVTLLDAPALTIADGAGRTVRIGAGKPVLINLWASWCAPCVAELGEIRDREEEIRAAGLEVVALSVDALDSEAPDIAAAAAAAAAAAIGKLDFPFVSAIASEQVVGLLQWHHDNAVGRKRRLPLPSSFLIDADGQVAVIYKGRLSVDALLADVAQPDGTRPERWLRAALLPGRAIDHPSIRRSGEKIEAKLYFDHAQQQEGLGAIDLAVKYYGEALRCWPEFDPAQRSLGNLYAKQRRWREALSHFEALILLRPDEAPAHFAAAACYQQLGQGATARPYYEAAVRLDPAHVPALEALATMDLAQGDTAAAVGGLRRILELAPEHPSARDQLARILASHPDLAPMPGSP